jgi:hypothetical protein
VKIRTIAIEEHFSTPHLWEELSELKPAQGELNIKLDLKSRPTVSKKLFDLGEGRLADMDASGIDMQVLQLSGPSFDGLDKDNEAAVVRESNDLLAGVISKHPDRFAGFAQLNLGDPEGAAAELERCVTKLGLVGGVWSGKSKGHYLDHPSFQPVWAVAEKLDVPIYLHPGYPSQELAKALYSDLPDGIVGTLARAGWGWHMENGFHSLRLVLSGLFDRFPKLQFIIGHMGEGIPFSLARANTWLTPLAKHLNRSIEEYYLTNFHITTSGFFSLPTLLCAIMVFGVDRVIFSVDYPYSSNEEGRRFLDAIPLSHEDLEKISYKNAERLLKL